MAGCKSSISGNDFYGAYDAQEIATKHAAELGMQVCKIDGGDLIIRHAQYDSLV